MRIDWAPLMPGIIGMTQQGYNQVQIAKACGVSRSALNSMMARKGNTVERIKHDFNRGQALQARLKEVDDILEAVGDEYGGKEHWPNSIALMHEHFAIELYKRARNK